MKLNKWCFYDFKEEICNYNYVKTIPFCTFSESSFQDYRLIGDVLDSIYYDRDKLVVIGDQSPPFGYHVVTDNDKDKNILLNSCQFGFALSPSIKDTNIIIRCVLAGVIPICNEDHPYVKQLGLKSFSVDLDKQNIIDKLYEIKYNQHIYHHKIYQLSWKYHNRIKK